MKRNIRLVLLLLLSVTFISLISCSKKKETRRMITIIDETPVSDETKIIGDTVISSSYDWGGTYYTARITCAAEKETTVKDEDGQKYYDNTIRLEVEGPNGSIYDKTFHKGDFSSYINTNYIKPDKSALLSIIFNRVEGSSAIFTATVGSPDSMDDETMSVQIALNKSGGVAMSKIEADEGD